MDGLTLLTKINEMQNPAMKCIMVSAYGDMGNIRSAMNNGAFDFATKPIDLDDLSITINGADARIYASQGQARTAALSMKLAEREIFLAETGEIPVLLLDDVLSELDAARQEFVLNRIGGGQTLVTCCEAASVARLTGGRVLYMEKGRVRD